MRINTGYVKIGQTAKTLMHDVLESSKISNGKYVRQLEEMHARKHDVKHAICVGSGTEADYLAIRALKEKYGLPDGGEIVCPALTFISVANAIVLANMTPVFVDTDPFNMRYDDLEHKIDWKRTRAILAVHFGGLPLDMKRIRQISRMNGDIPIIEDCACAHGSMADGRMVGGFGDISTWSMYVAHIVTAGGGGIVGTNDDELADIIRSLRAYGRMCRKTCGCNECDVKCGGIQRFKYDLFGINSRMTEMEAVIGIDQMQIYDEIVRKRIDNFELLKHLLTLSGILPEKAQTFMQDFRAGFKMCPIFFPLVLTKEIDRTVVMHYLNSHGIETRPLYFSIPTQQQIYATHFQSNELFIEAERVGERGLYVGIHQGITQDDVGYIANKITLAIRKGLK